MCRIRMNVDGKRERIAGQSTETGGDGDEHIDLVRG